MAVETPRQRLQRIRREADQDIEDLLLLWADASETWAVTRAHLADMLEAGHVDAHAAGRQLAGEPGAVTDEDRTEGAAAWAADSTYWDKLDKDVVDGRYGTPGSDVDPPKTDALAKRVQLYPLKWRATADEAWILSLPADTLVWWILDDGAHHCTQCPDHADGSPYTPDTMPGWPGDGATCNSVVNCKCFLRLEDGTEGFQW